MGKIVGWTLLWLLGFALAGASMSWAAMDDAYEKRVQSECGFTTYPKLCVQTLLGLGRSKVDIPFVLVNKILSETRLPTSNIAKFSYQLATPEAHSAHLVRDSCDMLMSMSLKQLNQSLLALKESARKNKHDIQTWLSAALTFQQTCKDLAVEMTRYFGTSMVQISSKMDHLSQLTNNALAVINRITPGPKKTTSGRGLSEEQVFPSWVSPRDRKLLQTTTIKANAIVAQDGTGNYETISDAIQAATGKRFVIYVKSGVYKEKIHTNKDGITLIGDGKYSTRIVGDDSVGGGASLLSTATFTITGDGFIAKDIGFENAAGPKGEQAVALMVSSDHSVLYKCSIAGYQDTLYAQALRQFYRECHIYGTIDFIFGNAAAVFQNCYLILRRPLGDSFNVILANGRSSPGQNTGFSIQKCTIIPSSDFSAVKHSYKSYLGRPWKEYSRAVVMESSIDDAIEGRGWIEWPGYGSSVLKSLYFAEYSNIGGGAATSRRVQWPGFHLIGTEEAAKFTVANFIAGTSWLPSTGVIFISGLQ
ncbi:pectinesterase [Vitis riparia]|uniref:pectinesterase n=1 Tax=Vitis riparia TaxID=96939 RepID=UPI00155A2D9D|nr:pectinesterase [Vitis riparia]